MRSDFRLNLPLALGLKTKAKFLPMRSMVRIRRIRIIRLPTRSVVRLPTRKVRLPTRSVVRPLRMQTRVNTVKLVQTKVTSRPLHMKLIMVSRMNRAMRMLD